MKRLRGLSDDRAAFHLQAAAVRIAAQLASAVDDRRVQRRRPHDRMRGRACSSRSSCSSARSTRPIRRIASRPSRGRLPCAARPRVSISTHANPLCPTPICRSVGSVTTAASARPLRDERVGADARVLLVDDRGDDQTPLAEAAVARDARGVDHRRDAALHVLRAASVQPAVALDGIERRGHAVDADGVDVPAEHQRAARARRRRARRSRSVARARPPASRRRARAARMCAAMASAICASPAAPGTSDGLTESIATSSRSKAMHGSVMSALLAGRRRVTSLAGCGSLVTVLCANGSLAARRGDHRRIVGHRARDRAAARARRRRGGARGAARGPAGGGGPRHPRRPADAPSRSSWTSPRRPTCCGSSAARARRSARLDIMICNAGFGYYGTVEDTPARRCSG